MISIAKLLNTLPEYSSAVITGADSLIAELFTHNGKSWISYIWMAVGKVVDAVSYTVLSISTDVRRRASATSIRDVSYFFPKLKKGRYGPLLIPSPTLLKLAAYFKLYWNPWIYLHCIAVLHKVLYSHSIRYTIFSWLNALGVRFKLGYAYEVFSSLFKPWCY